MTEILFIADNSYSTMAYLQPYLNAINGIVNVQKELAPNSLLTFVTFNQTFKRLCTRKRVSELTQELAPEQFKPEGMTAMYDCISMILHTTIKFQKKIESAPPICIILTDGEDNMSKRIDARLCALQINMAKAQGYRFIFLGTTEKAVELGRAMGCQTCILYNPTVSSLGRIAHTVAKLFQQPIQEADIDIRDLTDSMAEMKM